MRAPGTLSCLQPRLQDLLVLPSALSISIFPKDGKTFALLNWVYFASHLFTLLFCGLWICRFILGLVHFNYPGPLLFLRPSTRKYPVKLRSSELVTLLTLYGLLRQTVAQGEHALSAINLQGRP